MNSASLVGRYNNPIPTLFLAPIDYLKIPSLPAFADVKSRCGSYKEIELGGKGIAD
jgi:hypothetical protein